MTGRVEIYDPLALATPVLAVALLAALLVAIGLCLRRRMLLGRTMKKLDEMLDAAIDGCFTERHFDESLLSATESKFAAYLSASEVSARNLGSEKDKIKEMISDISHQTKTPIANILLYSELLAEQERSPEGEHCISALSSEAEKLNFLIISLVKLSRLETGILTLTPTKGGLASLLEAVQQQFSPKAAEKTIALQLEPTRETAIFDAKWTNEAISNLVDNAIKYTPEGGTVSLSVTAFDLFCRIDVTDSGSGIAEDEQAKIFGRFYRSPTAATQEGVGIGLYLARKIIEDEGGYIKVSSAPGAGSTFSVFLPR